MKTSARVALVLSAVLSACTGGGGHSPAPLVDGQNQPRARADLRSQKIHHVVIIFQENRTVDNLFNGFPGADTAQYGRDSSGALVALQPISLTAPYDLDHSHGGWKTEYDLGKLDGWDLVTSSGCTTGVTCPPPNRRAYGYVPRSETQPYWQMASDFTLGDRMFQTNEGPSFPAHQYIISGTSLAAVPADPTPTTLLAAENPYPGAGCDASAGSLVRLIDPATGAENQTAYPCFEHQTLFDLIDKQPALSWRYYQATPGAGLWNADAIYHIRHGADYANVSVPSTNVLGDIANGKLASVSWVMPTAADSDHAKITDGSGPQWVASIVNAIGRSPYWNDTAIFVTWDDWGGWFDHAAPQRFNYYELGFRVPLLVISPYAKPHYVSHVQHEFGSLLKFTETTFGLGTLGYTDARADDLADCFDFTQAPIPFPGIQGAQPASHFQHLAADTRDPDDDR